MPSCCVSKCSSRTGVAFVKKVKYFSFPKDPVLQAKWLTACRKPDNYNVKIARVCEKHFTLDCFVFQFIQSRAKVGEMKKILKLKKNSLPTLHLTPPPKRKVKVNHDENIHFHHEVPVNNMEASIRSEVRSRSCYVPYCKTGYKSSKEKCSLFSVPKNIIIRKLWNSAILRMDRDITEKDVVCEKHFEPFEIVREWISGDIRVPYKKPTLAPGAVPSLFPDSPVNITIKSVKNTYSNKKKSTKNIDLPLSNSENCSSINIEKDPLEITSKSSLFNNLLHEKDSIKLPSNWIIQFSEKEKYLSIVHTNFFMSMPFHKCVTINENSKVKCFLNGLKVNYNFDFCNTKQQFEDILKIVSLHKICHGTPIKYNKIKSIYINSFNRLQSPDCELLYDSTDSKPICCLKCFKFKLQCIR